MPCLNKINKIMILCNCVLNENFLHKMLLLNKVHNFLQNILKYSGFRSLGVNSYSVKQKAGTERKIDTHSKKYIGCIERSKVLCLNKIIIVCIE